MRFILFFLCVFQITIAQPNYWQQKADYQMTIDFDDELHQFTGLQKLIYTNNSPDTLSNVYYHLYYNAFQPGSMMDMRSQNLLDPDPRVGSKISELKKNEQGWTKIHRLSMDGRSQSFYVNGTILEVKLDESILPGHSVRFEMDFRSQVPIHIRRTGRNNSEGVSYSMAQWYPKICEYDDDGWHATPYVGREFYGVWGNFDVTIKIVDKYTLGAGGELVNKEEIGRGYSEADSKPNGSKLSWNFKAENVHDFVWAADPDFIVISRPVFDGKIFYYVFEDEDIIKSNWLKFAAAIEEAYKYMNENYGTYPYPNFSFIQGGDGGMEYPMATLVLGEKRIGSLIGTGVHELMHCWYYGVIANNESLHPWMDEGIAGYLEDEVLNHLAKKGFLNRDPINPPQRNKIEQFTNYAKQGFEEPLSIHADHFDFNQTYTVAVYLKGAVMLSQLEYIIGKKTFKKALNKFYNEWQFKHPDANDFMRSMEKTAGIELDWFKQYWLNSTQKIDYSIKKVDQNLQDSKAIVHLERKGGMPMPIDLLIMYDNGSTEIVNIPLRIMRGSKSDENRSNRFRTAEDWPWTHPEYFLELNTKGRKILSLEIDSSNRLADIDRDNNTWKP